MIITVKRLEELRNILTKYPLVIESDQELNEAGIAITRFVLLKEIEKLNQGHIKNDQAL